MFDFLIFIPDFFSSQLFLVIFSLALFSWLINQTFDFLRVVKSSKGSSNISTCWNSNDSRVLIFLQHYLLQNYAMQWKN